MASENVNNTNTLCVAIGILLSFLLVLISILSHYCFHRSSYYFEEHDLINPANKAKKREQSKTKLSNLGTTSAASNFSPAPSQPTSPRAGDTALDDDEASVTESGASRPSDPPAVAAAASSQDANITKALATSASKNASKRGGSRCRDILDWLRGIFSLSLEWQYASDAGMSLNAANSHRFPNWTVRTSNFFLAHALSLLVALASYAIFWRQDMISDTSDKNYDDESNYTSVVWVVYLVWYLVLLFCFWTLFRWMLFVVSKYHGMLCFVFEVFYEVNHGYWRYYIMTRDFRKFNYLQSKDSDQAKGGDSAAIGRTPLVLPSHADSLQRLDTGVLGGSDGAITKLGTNMELLIEFERTPSGDSPNSPDAAETKDSKESKESKEMEQKDGKDTKGRTGTTGGGDVEMVDMEDREESQESTSSRRSRGHGRKRMETDADEVITELFDVGDPSTPKAGAETPREKKWFDDEVEYVDESDETRLLMPYKPLWYVMMRDKYHIYYYNTLVSDIIGDWPYYTEYKIYLHSAVVLVLLYASLDVSFVSESNNYGVFLLWVAYGVTLLAQILHNWEDLPYDECDYDARNSLPETLYKISEEIEFAQGFLQLLEIATVLFCALFWFVGVFYQVVVLLETVVWEEDEESFEQSEFYTDATGETASNPYYKWRVDKLDKFVIFILLSFVICYTFLLGVFYIVTVLYYPRRAYVNMRRYVREIQETTQQKRISNMWKQDSFIGDAPNSPKQSHASQNAENDATEANADKPRKRPLAKYKTLRNILSKRDFQWQRKDNGTVDLEDAAAPSVRMGAGDETDENDEYETKGDTDGEIEQTVASPKKRMKIMVSEVGGSSRQVSIEDEPLVQQYNENLDYKELARSPKSMMSIDQTFGAAIRAELARARNSAGFASSPLSTSDASDAKNDTNDAKDTNDTKDANDTNEANVTNEATDGKDAEDATDATDAKDQKETNDANETTDEKKDDDGDSSDADGALRPSLDHAHSMKSIELVGCEQELKEELQKAPTERNERQILRLERKIEKEKKRRRVLWMLNPDLSLVHMLSWQANYAAFEKCVDFAIKCHCLDHILAFIELVQFRLFVIGMEQEGYGRKDYAANEFAGRYNPKWDWWEWPGFRFPNRVPKSYIVFHDYSDEIKRRMHKRTVTASQVMLPKPRDMARIKKNKYVGIDGPTLTQSVASKQSVPSFKTVGTVGIDANTANLRFMATVPGHEAEATATKQESTGPLDYLDEVTDFKAKYHVKNESKASVSPRMSKMGSFASGAKSTSYGEIAEMSDATDGNATDGTVGTDGAETDGAETDAEDKADAPARPENDLYDGDTAADADAVATDAKGAKETKDTKDDKAGSVGVDGKSVTLGTSGDGGVSLYSAGGTSTEYADALDAVEETNLGKKDEKSQFQEYLFKAYQLFAKYHRLIYTIHRYSKETPFRENDETLNKYVYYRLRKLFKDQKRVLMCDVSKAVIDFADIKSTDENGENTRWEWNRDNIYSIFDLTCLLIVKDLQDKIWNQFEKSDEFEEFESAWKKEVKRRESKLNENMDQVSGQTDEKEKKRRASSFAGRTMSEAL